MLKARGAGSKTKLISVASIITPHPPIARPEEDMVVANAAVLAVAKVLLAMLVRQAQAEEELAVEAQPLAE